MLPDEKVDPALEKLKAKLYRCAESGESAIGTVATIECSAMKESLASFKAVLTDSEGRLWLGFSVAGRPATLPRGIGGPQVPQVIFRTVAPLSMLAFTIARPHSNFIYVTTQKAKYAQLPIHKQDTPNTRPCNNSPPEFSSSRSYL